MYSVKMILRDVNQLAITIEIKCKIHGRRHEAHDYALCTECPALTVRQTLNPKWRCPAATNDGMTMTIPSHAIRICSLPSHIKKTDVSYISRTVLSRVDSDACADYSDVNGQADSRGTEGREKQQRTSPRRPRRPARADRYSLGYNYLIST